MTVQEAIEDLKEIFSEHELDFPWQDTLKVLNIAIKCMEEVEQYRALGTVEELKEAREKQVAKKPIGIHTDYKCSVCGRRVRSGKGSSSRQRDNFCQRCGQRISWTEEGES